MQGRDHGLILGSISPFVKREPENLQYFGQKSQSLGQDWNE
jgi:hypothetical protein